MSREVDINETKIVDVNRNPTSGGMIGQAVGQAMASKTGFALTVSLIIPFGLTLLFVLWNALAHNFTTAITWAWYLFIAAIVVVIFSILVHIVMGMRSKQIALRIQHQTVNLQIHQMYLQQTLVNYAMSSGAGIKALGIEISHPTVEVYADDEYENTQALLPSPSHVLSFAELLRTQVIQKAVEQDKLILGYIDNELKYGSWQDLYSCAVAGISGSGKTTTVLFLLFQAVLCNAGIVLIDPHLHNREESLAARLYPLRRAIYGEPIDDSNEEAILKRVHWFKAELARRKAAGQKGRLIIFCIDEFNAVMRLPLVKPELAELLVAIEQEGRKFGIFALLIGQVWTAAQIGGADLRRSLASRIVHRIDEEYAKLLLGSKYGKQCIELEVGHSWFRDTNGGTSKLIIPATYREDGYGVAEVLGWEDYHPTEEENEDAPVSRRETVGTPVETASKANGNIISHVFPVSVTSEEPANIDTKSVSTETRNTMRRMAARGVPHRDIAHDVGLYGRKYALYQQVCREEGINDQLAQGSE